MQKIKYFGMDVHKEKIVVAVSEKEGHSEIIGSYPNTEAGLKKMITMFKKAAKDSEIKICYEAGPCGYAVKRILDKNEFKCEIAAPSLIPVKSGLFSPYSKLNKSIRETSPVINWYGA